LRQKVKTMLCKKRGAALAAFTEALNPLLRGWKSYFRHAEIKGVWQDLDG
jgi:RNA-directed DNA polymerase